MADVTCAKVAVYGLINLHLWEQRLKIIFNLCIEIIKGSAVADSDIINLVCRRFELRDLLCVTCVLHLTDDSLYLSGVLFLRDATR